MAKESSRTRKTILNISTSFGAQLLTTVMNFLVRTVFIHTLGKVYLGISGLFTDLLSMLSLTEMGLDMAITYKLYKPIADRDSKRVRLLLKFYKKAYRVIGLTVLVLGLCMIPALPVLIKDYDTLEALHLNAAFIFLLHLLRSVSSYLFFAYRGVVIRADQKKYVLDIVSYFFTIAMNIIRVLILVLWGNFVLYTSVILFISVLESCTNAVIIKRRYKEYFEDEPDNISREEVKELFKDCGALLILRINSIAMKATDNTVISAFIGLKMVGIYSNYLLFYRTILGFAGRFYSGAKASVGNMYVTESLEKSYGFFQVMNYAAILIYGTGCVGVALCADELIEVWAGGSYVLAKPFSTLVGIEILAAGLFTNLNQMRDVSGMFRQMWFRPLMGMIFNVGFSIGLVQVWGIHGVIAATIISELLTNFMVDPYLIYKYCFRGTKPVLDYYKKIAIYLAVLVLIWLADGWLCSVVTLGPGWPSVICHIFIVGVSVPLTMAVIFWKTKENQYLWKLAKRILAR